MKHSDYSAIPGWNWSKIKLLHTHSPAHIRGKEDHDTPTRMFDRAVHCLVLEPANFDRDFVVAPGTRTAALKEAVAASGKTLITATDADKARSIARAVHTHPATAPLFAPGFRSELARTWTDADTGLPCKGRLDLVTSGIYTPGAVEIWDLKDYGSTNEDTVRRMIRRMMAACQLAHYRAGQLASPKNAGRPVTCGIISVEHEPPWDVAVFPISDADLDAADELRRELLARLKECVDTDTWPGRHPQPFPLSLEWDSEEDDWSKLGISETTPTTEGETP